MPLLRPTPKGFALDVKDVCFIEVIQSTCKKCITSDAVITRDSRISEQIAQGLVTLLKFVLFKELNSSVEAHRKLAIDSIIYGHLERV
jgi:hypothetical protein